MFPPPSIPKNAGIAAVVELHSSPCLRARPSQVHILEFLCKPLALALIFDLKSDDKLECY